MSKKIIFKDQSLQELYLQQGYVVLPILSKEKIEEMLDLHQSTHPSIEDLPNCYNTSDHVPSLETKRKVKNEISKALEPLFNNYLNGFKPIYVNFIGKKKGEKSNRDLHQDYSFCNELECDGYNIWIPLQDITEHNSYFSIVRNSYRFFHSFRGRQIHHRFEDISDKIMEKFCTNIYPKAGHALIYNTASIHFTPNSTSNDIRIAISAMTIPEEANINLYQTWKDTTDQLERFEVDDEFLLEYPAWKKIEDIESKEIFSYDNSQLDWKAFENAYYLYNTDVKRPSFWKKLLRME
ncbi:MAG TPA: phytanoyl-CoA dioxygenase family protein [Chitinophagales bacterium]|nr:phytanoyl-CoA dioxygenase family protein [Chitinophagales bacterium]